MTARAFGLPPFSKSPSSSVRKTTNRSRAGNDMPAMMSQRAAKLKSPLSETARPCQNRFFIYSPASFMAESSDTMDMKEFQLHEKDTGSADVQVALLTRRIAQLTEHLKSHAK